MALETGRSATVDREVGPQHTAVVVESGDVEVLATPQVLAWCEAATVAAVVDALDPDDTTVGTEVHLEHMRPTAVGSAVRVHATLNGIDGRRLTFRVEAHDESGEIATGEVVRVLVNRSRFVERLRGS